MTFRTDYDGRSIMENVEYVSAVVLKRTLDTTDVLVKLQDGSNLLIHVTKQSFAGQEDKMYYEVHAGANVDKLAKEHAKCDCVAHKLLLEMKA